MPSTRSSIVASATSGDWAVVGEDDVDEDDVDVGFVMLELGSDSVLFEQPPMNTQAAEAMMIVRSTNQA